MGKKINLFHRKIEVKLLLEVLGVYAVLALALTGMYYLEPRLTGFAAAENQLNYGGASIEILESVIEDGNWIVKFKTSGTGSLMVSATGGTYAELYNDDYATMNSMDILELRCGEFEIFNNDNLIITEGVWFILLDDSLAEPIDLVWESMPIKGAYIESYNCDDEIGYYTARTLKEGSNIQEFEFGGEVESVGIS
ncbi:hypothetical protein KY347_03500 [Candidatus Woesearchaeota archaeon]|nr:hypothetical protein [Candidatus Woesearchaeota archaeon]